MLVLAAFAFLAGVVTILSPCILPILPIVLSGSVTGGKKRPWGIVTGFVLSFTFFTLFLSPIVRATGVSPDALRTVSVIIIGAFGLSLLIPQVQAWLEQLFSSLASRASGGQQKREGFHGGVLIGLSLGLIWTPCVGSILASVISLALTGSLSGAAVLITFAYALGTALPMLAILYGGRALLQKAPRLMRNTGNIQKAFGVLMILIAVAIQFNYDRKFQAYILEKFPQYGAGLTKFEDNEAAQKQLEDMNGGNPPWPSATPPGEGNTSPKSPLERGVPTTSGRGVFLIAQDLGEAPALVPGGEWFNSEPLTLERLRGKVVLVDFWTYTCINCIRTFPALKAWHEKYADKGLVIIGVHAPEFEFEKNPVNVQKAIEAYGLSYPIVQDNDFATWRAYRNRYWPAEYFVDKNGHIRRTHFGEGDYKSSEEAIQALLGEIGQDVVGMPTEEQTYKIDSRTPELYLGYKIDSRTPELYLGYERIEFLASPETIARGTRTRYSIPSNVPRNRFAWGGEWEIHGERASPAQGSTLVLHFDAKNVFLVMQPKEGIPGSVRVLLDGQELSDGAGKDVTNTIVIVNDDRLYSIIELSAPEQHILELEFLNDGLELYAFTFG